MTWHRPEPASERASSFSKPPVESAVQTVRAATEVSLESTPVPSSGGRTPVKTHRRTLAVIGLIAVVIVSGVVGTAYAVAGGFHQNGGSAGSITLIERWTYDSIPGSQFDAVAFVADETVRVNGTFTNSLPIVVYLMTPGEFSNLSKNLHVTGYSWTSGSIANLTIYGLNITVAAGPWDLVFLNPDPDPLNTTIVDFWSPVTEIPR